MKKIIFLLITVVAVTACLVACNTDSSTTVPSTSTKASNISTSEAVPEPECPKLSVDFIKTALQFVDNYSTPSKKLENLATEVIQLSDGYGDKLYAYLNYRLTEKYGESLPQFLGYGCDTLNTVKVFIHNYKDGTNVGCVSYNEQDATYNYDHDTIILSAGILGEKYPDNVSLANARIASYVLTQMNKEDVNCCIVTNKGKSSYDFTFENEAFREIAREILHSLSY